MPDLIPDTGPGWETALLLPVPAAEPAVGRHRARLVESARNGVPALSWHNSSDSIAAETSHR